MKQLPTGEWVMKSMNDLMELGVSHVPQNLLHVYQVRNWDFGLEGEVFKHRRINFVFGVKHKNDGKINSHKYFFQAICEYLQPEYCLMLDIGTRADKGSIYKLYNYMKTMPNCGGCC